MLQGYGDTDEDRSAHDPHSTAGTRAADPEKSEDALTLQEDGEERMEARVGNLARQLTRQSTRFSAKGGTLENPFHVKDLESTLNPDSPNFKPRDWLKMLLAIRSRDPEQYPDRTAGVAFRNLNVHGFGSPTDYQKDVLNSLLEVGTIFRKLAGIKMQKIQILREFDGLVKSGEMLVVLGRPGSGCSTFLKTIAGEMNGIEMSDDSVLNYQGRQTENIHTFPFSPLSYFNTVTDHDA
jgi:ABC-type glutathione transport system ATPase component